MKILMMTPRVDENHDLLGFIPTWISKLAKKADKLYMITPLYNIETKLPENTTVYSINTVGVKNLGKFVRFSSRLLYLHNIMLKTVPKVDVVFCHMSPRFTIWVAPYAKLFRKPIVTWYTHGHISRKLRIAHFLSNKMVTASKESLRINSDKIIITGHGIDTDRFKPAMHLERKNQNEKTILSVSRISPRKDLETLIKAADILVNKRGMKNLEFLVVGAVPMTSQEGYFEELQRMVEDIGLEDYVKFVGCVPYTKVVGYYQGCEMHINLCPTGGIDKAVLEAMACEKPVLVCNETFEDTFGDLSSILIFNEKDPADLGDKITRILQMDENRRREMCHNLRGIVERGHSVESLAGKLVDVFKSGMKK